MGGRAGGVLEPAAGVLVDHQVAADHGQAEVGAVEADVLGAVGVQHDVLDQEVLAVGEAEDRRVVGDVGPGLGDRRVPAGRGGRGPGGDGGGDEGGGGRYGSGREEAARRGGGAHSDSSRGCCVMQG